MVSQDPSTVVSEDQFGAGLDTGSIPVGCIFLVKVYLSNAILSGGKPASIDVIISGERQNRYQSPAVVSAETRFLPRSFGKSNSTKAWQSVS